MLNKIYSVLAILLFFVLCKGCISDYIKGGDNKAIGNYEKMLFDNTTATAKLSSTYKETTVKIAGLPIKTYDFRYSFNVNGVDYSGGNTFKELPKNPYVKVYYLKEDPYFNCVDPKELLATEKAKNTSKTDLYWGIAWGVLGLLTLLGFISELKEKWKANTSVA